MRPCTLAWTRWARWAAACAVLGVLLAAPSPRGAAQGSTAPAPIDPQRVRDQDEMTWDDYRPIPGHDWTDPAKQPSERTIRIALVAADFEDQPFVITLPKHSDLFGNPQIDPIPREEVARFYADFWNKPQPLNHFHTVHEYWMELSHGKIGVTFDAYGPYRMPRKMIEYSGTVNAPRRGGGATRGQRGAEEPTSPALQGRGTDTSTSPGARGRGTGGRGRAGGGGGPSLTGDLDALWRPEAQGKEYDLVLRIYAGYDETCVWQEFGEMKFQTRDDIPPEWGPPDPTQPRWAPTRYVEWTSWKAASYLWSNSSIIQGECSGSIRHEISHAAFRIGDNNNNPYVQPYRRAGSGPWDVMDRGSFNGPGGPHRRWLIPVLEGGAMPAGLMLRQRIDFGFADEAHVLRLSREGLAQSGPAVARVTARAVQPIDGNLTGIVVRLDGAEPHDRTPPDDPATNPLSPGVPNYNFYSLEVVERIGYDSFCPDSGVLIAKNKDRASSTGGPNGFMCFNWVIDAHPEDINRIDFRRPNGEVVMRTIADYRQLNDALFHAGTDSGSRCEYVDEPNRLHFYVLDVGRDARGILTYTLGVRSLDGAGPHRRAAALAGPARAAIGPEWTAVEFTLRNPGQPAATDPALHPEDARAFLGNDIYRLAAEVEGEGWSVKLLNELAAVPFGGEQPVRVYVARTGASAPRATLRLRATSESDRAAAAERVCELTAQ